MDSVSRFLVLTLCAISSLVSTAHTHTLFMGNVASGLALQGSRLYVANTNARAITVFDAGTGALINSHFISALDAPIKLTLSGNVLFVEVSATGKVATHNALNGQPIALDLNYRLGTAEDTAVNT